MEEDGLDQAWNEGWARSHVQVDGWADEVDRRRSSIVGHDRECRQAFAEVSTSPFSGHNIHVLQISSIWIFFSNSIVEEMSDMDLKLRLCGRNVNSGIGMV